MTVAPARSSPAADQREQGWNLVLALVASTGMHLIFLMTLDASAPGPWQHGLQPALQVSVGTSSPIQGLPPTLGTADGERAQPRKPATATPTAGRRAQESADGASLPGELRYYRASEVDVPPTPLNRPHLVIPEIAYVSRLAGTVRARIYIGEQGGVEHIEILRAEPRAGIFEDAAVEALRKLRYAPAELSGRPVKSVKTIEVIFDPSDDGRDSPQAASNQVARSTR